MGTSDNNFMSLNDDQRSIPSVGDDHDERAVTDMPKVRPRGAIVGGAPIFPIGTTVLSTLLTAVFYFP